MDDLWIIRKVFPELSAAEVAMAAVDEVEPDGSNPLVGEEQPVMEEEMVAEEAEQTITEEVEEEEEEEESYIKTPTYSLRSDSTLFRDGAIGGWADSMVENEVTVTEEQHVTRGGVTGDGMTVSGETSVGKPVNT